jgi:transposase-like protein
LAKTRLLELSEKWGTQYALAVRSWEQNWNEFATFFDYTLEIRRLIYITNPIEGYNRQLRKVTKSKATFPTDEAVRKMRWLAHRDIVKKWTMPIQNWAMIVNQLAIRFDGRFPA